MTSYFALCWLATLGTACSSLPRGSDTSFHAPELISFELRRVDDQSDERPYLQAANYMVSFTCVQPQAGLTHPSREGFVEHGELTVYPPASCFAPASVELTLLPANLQRCSGTQLGPIDITRPDFKGTLIVRIPCESALRSAKLSALPLLECDDRATAIARTGEHSFRAEGCGRSLLLQCYGDPFGDDYICESNAH